MTQWDSAIAACPHRIPPATDDDNDEPGQSSTSYRCSLVERHIDGLRTIDRCISQVTQDICKSCVSCGPPHSHRLNPWWLRWSTELSRIWKPVSSRVYLPVSAFCGDRYSTFVDKRISRGELASADSEDGTSQDCTDSNLHLASTARAVTTKRRIGRFPFFSFSGIRLGLIGRNSPYGLGHQHRDLVDRLKVRAWLAPYAPEDSAQPCPRQCEIVPRAASPEFFSAFLNRIDVLMFVERPPFESLISMARERGIRVVCVPNWEWITPSTTWLFEVDLMLCPCRKTFELLSEWKRRFGFRWQLECIPWPIPIERFPFRQRTRCERFVFVGGKGGCLAAMRMAATT